MRTTVDGIGEGLPFHDAAERDRRRYRIEVRPQHGFSELRLEDLNGNGHVQRVVGRAKDRWLTLSVLIAVDDAHVESGRLVGDTDEARDILERLGTEAIHVHGNRFTVKLESEPSPAGDHEAQREGIDARIQRLA